LTLGVDHHNEVTTKGMPNQYEAFLSVRVKRIRDSERQSVAEGSGCLLEGNPVLLPVELSLVAIPFETKWHAVYRS
jgi:hypothetical protein